MRLFLALGLTLTVGLGAAFRPSDTLPGREAGPAEARRVSGGGALVCTATTCGTSMPCKNNSCISGGGNVAQCNANCSFNGGCGGG
jgi:hypothetical protein